MFSFNVNPAESFSSLISMHSAFNKICQGTHQLSSCTYNLLRSTFLENQKLLLSLAFTQLLPMAAASFSANLSYDKDNSSILYCWQDFSTSQIGGVKVTTHHEDNFMELLNEYNEKYQCGLPAGGGFTGEQIRLVDSCFRNGLTHFEVSPTGETTPLVQDASQECFNRFMSRA